MPGTSKGTPLDTTIELSGTEVVALRCIVDMQKADRFHRAPTHRELILEMNKRLPKRQHGGPAISSTVQTNRIATKLRTKGYLVQVVGVEGSARSLVATPEGEKFVKSQKTPTQPNAH